MRAADNGSAVVAAYGHLVGILTSRDLLRAFAGRVHPSEARAREWMTAEPIAVSVNATVEDAYLLMAEHGIHHLPVVDGERPIGMLGFRQAAQARPASVRTRVLTHNVGAGLRPSGILCGKPATRSTAISRSTCGLARTPQSSARPTFN